MTGKGDDGCKLDLMLKIFLTEKHPNTFARSKKIVQSFIITSEDLCRIFLKLFHSDFGLPSFSAKILEI